jgi:hypothetical protein
LLMSSHRRGCSLMARRTRTVSEKQCQTPHVDFETMDPAVEPFVLRPIPQKKRAPLVDGLRSIKYGTLPGAFRSLRRSLTRETRRNLEPNEGPTVADAVDPCTPDVRPDEPTSPAPVLRPVDPAPTGTGRSPTSAD